MSECKKCNYCINDSLEGLLCTKYDGIISLKDGSKLKLYGQSCDAAYKNDCHGNGFKKAGIFTMLLNYF